MPAIILAYRPCLDGMSGIGEPTTSVELTYSVPAVIPGFDTIYFKMDAKDARRIVESGAKSKATVFHRRRSGQDFEIDETYFYHHFKIYSSACTDQIKGSKHLLKTTFRS